MTRVLILDDLPDYVRSLAHALARDFEVETALSLEEAVQKMKSDIDVCLVDIRLDEKDPVNRDGLKFLEWVKERYPRVPVIMMSAYRDFDAAVEALNRGAAYFLKKPIDLRHLKEILHRFAEGHEPDRQELNRLRESLKPGQ